MSDNSIPYVFEEVPGSNRLEVLVHVLRWQEPRERYAQKSTQASYRKATKR